MKEEDRVYLCTSCHWEKVPFARWKLGVSKKDPSYFTCLSCGEVAARSVNHTIVPMHKGHYFPVFDRKDLIGINNKGGIVR